MWLYCAVILCLASSDVGGNRQFRRGIETVNSTASSIANSSITTSSTVFHAMNSTVSSSNAKLNISMSVNKTDEILGNKSESVVKKQVSPSGLNETYSKYASGAALRGLYVFIGLSGVVMLYIAVKLIRLKRKKTHIRKYGLLSNADDLEMAPLDADDDDDEDTTLFDAHNHIGR